jgi:hypothetical protein
MDNRVCRHYLAGHCRLGDRCRFQHETGNALRQQRTDHRTQRPTVPCKFYLQGQCRKGTQCTFLHDVPTLHSNDASSSSSSSTTGNAYRSAASSSASSSSRYTSGSSGQDARYAFRDLTRRTALSTATSSYLQAEEHKRWLCAMGECLQADAAVVLEAMDSRQASDTGVDGIGVLKAVCRSLKEQVTREEGNSSGGANDTMVSCRPAGMDSTMTSLASSSVWLMRTACEHFL